MKFVTKMLAPAALLIALLVVSGCASDKAADSKDADTTTVAEKVDASEFLLSSEPATPKAVAALRESAVDDDTVVVVGRIGGSSHPWVEGAAAFTIVDESLPACGDEEECGCPTPWDYCCESAEDIVANSVIVKFVDENQRTRRFNPKEVFGVSELQTVVVEGTIDRDDSGKFTILAKKLFVRK